MNSSILGNLNWDHSIDLLAERLISSSLQGGLLLAVVWLVCHYSKQISANTKCWLWRIAYLKFAILLVCGGLLELPVLQPTSQSAPATTSNLSPANENLDTAHTLNSSLDSRQKQSETASSTNLPYAGAVQPTPPHFDAQSLWSANNLLFLIWSLGIGIGIAFVGRQYLIANRFVRHSVPIKNSRIATDYRLLCSRLKMSAPPRLAMTSRIETPVLVGAIRPTILIPTSMVRNLPSSDLKLIIAHELGHANRHDLIWNWLIVLVRTVFFFHPLVWATQKRFALDQEIACDQLALKTTQTDFHHYGRLLVNCSASTSRGATRNLAAVGAVSSFNTLKERILEMNRFNNQPSRLATLLSMTALVACIALLAPVQLVAQQNETNRDSNFENGRAMEQSNSATARNSNFSRGNQNAASQPQQRSGASAANGTNFARENQSTSSEERRNVSISINDGDHRESIKVAWKNRGVTVTYSNNADGSRKPQKHNLQDIAELEQINPAAYRFYKQHTTRNGDGVSATVSSGSNMGLPGINESRSRYPGYEYERSEQPQGFNSAAASSSSSAWENSSSAGRNGMTRRSNNSGGHSTSSTSGNVNQAMIQQLQDMMNKTDDPQMNASIQQMLNQFQNQDQNQGAGQGRNRRQ